MKKPKTKTNKPSSTLQLEKAYRQIGERNARIRWTTNSYQKLSYTMDSMAYRINVLLENDVAIGSTSDRRTKVLENLHRMSVAVGGVNKPVREMVLSDVLGLVSTQKTNGVRVSLNETRLPVSYSMDKVGKNGLRTNRAQQKK